MNSGEIADPNSCPEGHHPHHHHQIHFKVEGEPVEVLSENHEHAELKVREVLDISGYKPASDYWLIEYLGEGHKDRREYKDLDETVVIKNHTRFSVVCTKPTPVS